MIHSFTQDILISDETQCYKGYTDQYWYTVLHRIIWSVMKQWYTDQWWYTEFHRIYWSVMIQCYTGHTDHTAHWSVMIHSVTQDNLISNDTQCYTEYTDQWWYNDTRIYWSVMIHVLHRIYIDQWWYTVLHRIYWSVMIHSVTQVILISDETWCYTG